MDGGDGLLTDCRSRVPCGAVVAPGIVEPLRVEREAGVRELDGDFVPVCTLVAAEHDGRRAGT